MDVYSRHLREGVAVSYSTVLRHLRKCDGCSPYRTNPKRKPPWPYQTPAYPGDKWQMDVKFVPSECKSPLLPPDKRFYQYTVLDEASRKRFLFYCDEHSMANVAKLPDRPGEVLQEPQLLFARRPKEAGQKLDETLQFHAQVRPRPEDPGRSRG